MTVADAVTVLTDLGVIGVIGVAATIGLAALLFARFKRGQKVAMKSERVILRSLFYLGKENMLEAAITYLNYFGLYRPLQLVVGIIALWWLFDEVRHR